MPVVTLSYPCRLPSLEPCAMKAPVIWGIAKNVRAQLYGDYRPTPMVMDELERRCSDFLVNGIAFKVAWDRSVPVHNDAGKPVLGLCDYDGEVPNEVMLCLNRDLIAGSPHVEIATAAHELGHALFDMPAAVRKGMQQRFRFGDDSSIKRIAHSAITERNPINSNRTPSGEMNWEEYRANEFMGGFLAPATMLHKRLMILAFQLSLPMTEQRQHFGIAGHPVLADCRQSLPDLDHVYEQLGMEFGVSSQFIRVRLLKYRLIPEDL